jgi:GMP synthase-like glutamine amidotransferase
MKPVLVIRHAKTEGAGYLGQFFEQQNIPWQLLSMDCGHALPQNAEAYAGLVMMGGPMSVNDDLAWIAPELALIRDAVKRDIPVLGHCLGGQLISKALGARVSKNPYKEIGWGEVQVLPSQHSQFWFGDLRQFDSFHWHGETFALPEGATHLLSSPHCPHQAYSIGKHLAFQCHIEMTVEMIKQWCDNGQDELLEAADSPAVQQATQMQHGVEQRVLRLNQIAEQVYRQWIQGLSKS